VAGEDHHQISMRADRRRCDWGTALGLALLLVPGRALGADLAGAELAVEESPTATDCPTAETLATRVLALGSPPEERRAPLTLVVRFDRDLEGYVARIEATGRKQGTRELRTNGGTCRSLAEAAAVVLAVLSDLTPPHPPSSPPEAPAPVPATTPAPPAPAPTLALGLESGLAYGLSGNAATGTAALALRGRYRALALELGGFWSTPHFQSFAPGILEIGLLGGTALGCVWFGSGSHPELGGCAGAGLGSLSGSGHGYDHDDSAAILWLAGFGGVAARLPFNSRWAAALSLFAVLPFRSSSFLVGPVGDGFHSAPAAVLFRFGPEYRFW
jgi:hypothetical protein